MLFRSPSRMVLIAVVVDKRKSPPAWLVSLGEWEDVKRSINEYRKAVVSDRKKGRESLERVARALYEMVWKPLSIQEDAVNKIIIVPDEELHLLPFHAIQDREGRYLLQKANVVMLTTGRDIATPPKTLSKRNPEIFASPDYGISDKKKSAGKNEGI